MALPSSPRDQIPVLFLDFDGTLAPISLHPDRVRLKTDQIALLESLSRSMPVFVISGRAFPDIEQRIPVISLSGLSGDHGAVRKFKNRLHIHPEAARSKEALKDFGAHLVNVTNTVPGALTEVKDFSLSVHYRGVDADHLPLLTREVERLFNAWSERRRFRISPGKMVWEIRPSQGVTKEETVDFFLNLLREESAQPAGTLTPIMVGDDTTDLGAVNHAATLGGRGLWVGPPPQGLDPRVKILASPEEVWDLLARFIKVLESGGDLLEEEFLSSE